ncbi:MAG: hypothetical protein K0Q87_1133 [Neobacillus sp.]|jgi:regulatory protein YycI of two-component signal transduction system YycFG|nr:hypothetical protein [Neobacillus sp.]
MDWSKIKTIFILTFLILDVYLLYQFMEIRDANKYEIISKASIDDKLKLDEIKINVELPKAPIKDQYLNGKPKMFENADTEKVNGEKRLVKNPSTTLQVILKEPIQLNEKFEPNELTTFIKDNVLFGEEYQFWEKDDEKKAIIYFQKYKGMPLYENISGMLTFYYNGENQIVSYDQTYLEGIGELKEKEEILAPLKAIETLHQKGVLKPDSKITKIELGYSTFIQLAASQVLTPTWRFVVDDEESLFVNAFEGRIIQFNTDENRDLE